MVDNNLNELICNCVSDLVSHIVLDNVGVSGDDLSERYVPSLNEFAEIAEIEDFVKFIKISKVFDEPAEFYVHYVVEGEEYMMYMTAESVNFTVSTHKVMRHK